MNDYTRDLNGACVDAFQSPELFIIIEACDGTPTSSTKRQQFDITSLFQNNLIISAPDVMGTINIGSRTYLDILLPSRSSDLSVTSTPGQATTILTGSSRTDVTDLDVRFFTSITANPPSAPGATNVELATAVLATDFSIPYTEATVVVDALFGDGSRMNLRPEHGLTLSSTDANVVEIIDDETVSFIHIRFVYFILSHRNQF